MGAMQTLSITEKTKGSPIEYSLIFCIRPNMIKYSIMPHCVLHKGRIIDFADLLKIIK